MLMDVQHGQRGQPVFRHGVSKWRKTYIGPRVLHSALSFGLEQWDRLRNNP